MFIFLCCSWFMQAEPEYLQYFRYTRAECVALFEEHRDLPEYSTPGLWIGPLFDAAEKHAVVFYKRYAQPTDESADSIGMLVYHLKEGRWELLLEEVTRQAYQIDERLADLNFDQYADVWLNIVDHKYERGLAWVYDPARKNLVRVKGYDALGLQFPLEGLPHFVGDYESRGCADHAWIGRLWYFKGAELHLLASIASLDCEGKRIELKVHGDENHDDHIEELKLGELDKFAFLKVQLADVATRFFAADGRRK